MEKGKIFDDTDGSEHDAEPLLFDRSFSPKIHQRKRYVTAWALSWVFSLISTAFFTFLLTRSYLQHPLGSFDRGYTTDFLAARSSLRLQTQAFTGTPIFEEDGKMEVPTDSPSLSYMGSGPEVDAAWLDLIKDRYFLLTDSEAEQAWGEEYVQYWDELRGGYTAGLDVLHTLHCLNYVRMAIYPDVYNFDRIHGQVHQEHCINHLRQSIMCNADLTPIPSIWRSGIHRNYIDADRTHTCRDFGEVRRWATGRYNGSSAVKPRNRDGSPRREFFSDEILAGFDEARSP